MTQQHSKAKGPKTKDPKLDLSVGEILAATGATTLGALLVKVLDIWGTLLGTAVLSVCTSVGAVLILRTMRQTSERLKLQMAALAAATGRAAAEAPTVRLDAETVELASEAEDEGFDREEAAKSHSPRRTLIAIVVSSVVVFALTVGVLSLLGGLAFGDPARYIVEERMTVIHETVYVDRTEQGTAPQESGPEPTESEAPSESAAEESPSDEPADETPTGEEPTSESPTDTSEEVPTSDAASPSPQDEEVTDTETPSAR